MKRNETLTLEAKRMYDKLTQREKETSKQIKKLQKKLDAIKMATMRKIKTDRLKSLKTK